MKNFLKPLLLLSIVALVASLLTACDDPKPEPTPAPMMPMKQPNS